VNLISYNQQLSREFAENPTPERLARYAVSETLAPIEDYPNAVKIILDNYPRYTDLTSLIIGAYASSGWCGSKNELLNILNQKADQMSDQEHAILCFLNAHHLRMTDCRYSEKPEYSENLITSTRKGIPFVFNYLYLSELESDKIKSQELLSLAVENVQKVYSAKEIDDLTLEQFASPQFFIDHYILGTHLSYVVYEALFSQDWL